MCCVTNPDKYMDHQRDFYFVYWEALWSRKWSGHLGSPAYPYGTLIEYVRIRGKLNFSEHELFGVSMGVHQRWWWNKGITFPPNPCKGRHSVVSLRNRRVPDREGKNDPNFSRLWCYRMLTFDLKNEAFYWDGETSEKYMEAACHQEKKYIFNYRNQHVFFSKSNKLHLHRMFHLFKAYKPLHLTFSALWGR